MPRASAADAAATYDAILAAATDAFTRSGFHSVSLNDVAATAGVTRGAVYHHFTDKLGLFRAVVQAGHERVAAFVVARADAQGDDPRAALRAGCHAFVDGITEDPAARVLLIDGPAVLGWAQWRALDASASMKELREAVESVTGGDGEAMTRLLSGAMNEGAVWLLEDSAGPDATRALHRGLDTLIDAL